MMRRGLVPSWVESPAIGNRLIHAQAETVATKPSFRDAFRTRRCLIVVGTVLTFPSKALDIHSPLENDTVINPLAKGASHGKKTRHQ